MKQILILAFLIFFTSIYAQNEQKTRATTLEIDTSILFWSPSSSHMQSNNSVAQLNTLDEGFLIGYGSAVYPSLNFVMYSKTTNIGPSIGYSQLHMDNEFTTQDNNYFRNVATINTFQIGINGRLKSSTIFELYCGFGIDLFKYKIKMEYLYENGDNAELSESNIAFGLFLKTGMKIQLYKFISMKAGIEYSYIPEEIEYSNLNDFANNVKVDTNLGGIGLQIGLTFDMK